jgi:hypothetical protein
MALLCDPETFADLASQYVELHARKHNMSWKQAERLVARNIIPPGAS